jgi:hypothetical protein
MLGQQLRVNQQVSANVYGVASLPQINMQGVHNQGHNHSSGLSLERLYDNALGKVLSLPLGLAWNLSCSLVGGELTHQALGHCSGTAGIGFDNMIGDFPIKRIAFGHKVAQHLLRVAIL